MTHILGIDSSTQSTKAVLVDADDGTVLAERTSPHPSATEVDPDRWLRAVDTAVAALLPRAAAVSVAGQQHGMVAVDACGEVVRDALLWNDTRSASAAVDLVNELGGPQACAERTGSVLVASFTATKMRWMRDHEPHNAARTAQVLLPHDFVSAHLAAPGTRPFTDRGDASGTGYFATSTGGWLPDVAALAIGHDIELPRLVAPGTQAAETTSGSLLAGGTGDNMAAALGLALNPSDVLISLGTSGVVSATSRSPVADGSGTVTGFADAVDGFLPMVTTMNAAGILDLQASWLGVDHAMLADLAMQSKPGAAGVTLSPYYGGERTPNRPGAVGTWTGLSPRVTRADLARAAYEALLCSVADALEELTALTGVNPDRVLLVGGASRSPAIRAIAPGLLGRPIVLPAPAEYVALGAARHAAWAHTGSDSPPPWPVASHTVLEADPVPQVRGAYAALRERTAAWTESPT